MNERIKELFGKALDQAVPETWTTLSHEQMTKLSEVFAQLIVQECAEQVEQAKNSPFVSLDDAKRMKHFVDVTKKKIKKHFGVEE